MDTIDCITNVEELIENLEESSPEEYPSILKSMDIASEEFDEYKVWKEEGYSRNCIYRSANFELVLLCWKPGDETPIHSHDGQKCWVYQVESEIVEERYDKDETGEPQLIHTQMLSEGKLTYMEDRMGYHVLANRSDEAACTLHLYMLPIDSCEYFCEETGVFKEKELEYDVDASEPTG